MVTVKIHEPNEHLQFETPSQTVIKASNKSYTVVDALGRTIGFKKLKAIDRLRLLELVGADNAKNATYFSYVSLAYCVVSIDGEPMPPSAHKRHLEALVQRLEDDGLNAVAEGMVEQFGSPEDQDAFKAAVKNV